MVERLADILLLLRQRFRCRSSQPPIGEHLPPPSLLVDFRPRRTIALEKELAEIDRRIDRAVAAIIDGRITEQEAAAHLPALRQRRPALAAELASIGNAGVIVLRPAVVETYLRDLESLERAINSDLAIGVDPAANAIRTLIETVTVLPAPAGEAPGIIVRGDLAAVLGVDEIQKGAQRGGRGGSGGRI
jgi:hypothetical protein